MDRDKDARLTYDEFVEGSKQDPTIVQVSTIAATHSDIPQAELIILPGSLSLRRTGVGLIAVEH